MNMHIFYEYIWIRVYWKFMLCYVLDYEGICRWISVNSSHVKSGVQGRREVKKSPVQVTSFNGTFSTDAIWCNIVPWCFHGPLFWSWAPVQCTACTPLLVALVECFVVGLGLCLIMNLRVQHPLQLPHLRERLSYRILHDAQLLLNKQQQIWGGIYIHWHFFSSTDTVVLPISVICLWHVVHVTSCLCNLDGRFVKSAYN